VLNIEQPVDLNRFPLFESVRGLEVTLSPGDFLYIPAFWFHHVQALDHSVSVSMYTPSVEKQSIDNLFTASVSLAASNTRAQLQRATALLHAIARRTAVDLHEFVERLLHSRYTHFDTDPMLEGSQVFAFDRGEFEKFECVAVNAEQEHEHSNAVEQLHQRLSEIPEAVRELALADYIEELAGAVSANNPAKLIYCAGKTFSK
jgi:hypothetical protein